MKHFFNQKIILVATPWLILILKVFPLFKWRTLNASRHSTLIPQLLFRRGISNHSAWVDHENLKLVVFDVQFHPKTHEMMEARDITPF